MENKEIIKDEFGINCFKIKVNNINDLERRWGIKEIEYLADDYNENYYMLRNNGVFGLIVRKENCTII